jgi:hypothetical protein
VNDRSDQTRMGATLQLISKAEEADDTGTIQIQRLLAWYYAADRRAGRPAPPQPLSDAA